MKYGSVAGVAKPVARLIQGTLMLGLDRLCPSFELLDAIFASGGNAFDTAPNYKKGECEQVLGRWVCERGIRDKVVIITKCAHPSEDGRKRVTPTEIASDICASLQRLQTDHIDILFLHRDDPSVPVGPIIEALNEHLASGRIRAFGASNWTIERICAANEYATKHGLIPFAASSPHFSLAEQIREPWVDCVSISGPAGEEARKWYAATQMPLFAWSSLAGGFLSGRVTRANAETMKEKLLASTVRAYWHERNFQRLDRAAELAAKKGFSVPQIALAFLMNHPMNLFALVGCKTIEEFIANRAALTIPLTEAEMAWLDLRRDVLP